MMVMKHLIICMYSSDSSNWSCGRLCHGRHMTSRSVDWLQCGRSQVRALVRAMLPACSSMGQTGCLSEPAANVTTFGYVPSNALFGLVSMFVFSLCVIHWSKVEYSSMYVCMVSWGELLMWKVQFNIENGKALFLLSFYSALEDGWELSELLSDKHFFSIANSSRIIYFIELNTANCHFI